MGEEKSHKCKLDSWAVLGGEVYIELRLKNFLFQALFYKWSESF